MPAIAEDTGKTTITVDVAFREHPEGKHPPRARAYVFDSAGRLVESKAVSKEPLKFEVAAGQSYQVQEQPENSFQN